MHYPSPRPLDIVWHHSHGQNRAAVRVTLGIIRTVNRADKVGHYLHCQNRANNA